MEREHAPHRAPSPVLPAYRQTPSHRPITADLAHLQRAVGNRTASRMIAVQRNLEEVRASYNKTQDPPPKKDRILKKIRNDLNAIAENPAEEVKRIAAVRENLDVVLSV
jgi:hypothetical protein